MPTRVCVLTSVHQPFDGRIFYRECKTLAEADYKVTLVAPADFASQSEEGVEILGVPRPVTRRGRPLVWWRLFQQTRRLQPDIVHFHDPELLILVPLLRAALGRKLKLVYDVHEYFVDSLAEKFWIPRRLRPLAVRLAALTEKLLVKGLDGIVCAVEEQKPLYDGFGGEMVVVRNLPLTGLFTDAIPHPALDVDGFKMVYAGLILPERGIGTLLQAMHLLRERGIEDVHLFLIGPDTSPDYIHEIQEFARAHSLSDQIRWLGYVPHQEIKHYLVNADLGLAPGRRTRQYRNPGIATKLFEYMLCGLPILSVDHPHRRVYIEESNCGLLVPLEEASASAEAMLWLRDHPQEARAMGERGRAMVLDHYTWEQEQGRLLTFYNTLVSAG